MTEDRNWHDPENEWALDDPQIDAMLREVAEQLRGIDLLIRYALENDAKETVALAVIFEARKSEGVKAVERVARARYIDSPV